MAKQARWNSSRDGKILASLFENGIADPKCTKVSEIDPIKGMREEFKGFSDQQFRNNYRTTAASYIAGKAIEGTRYKALTCELRSFSFLSFDFLVPAVVTNLLFCCYFFQISYNS